MLEKLSKLANEVEKNKEKGKERREGVKKEGWIEGKMEEKKGGQRENMDWKTFKTWPFL